MEKLLLSIKTLFTGNSKLIWTALMLFVISGISNKSYGQIYYMLNDRAATSNDKVMRVPYTGGTPTLISTGQAVGPIEFAIDGNNNRLFLIDANQTTGQIKILNLTTGALIGTITSPKRMHQVKYDAATNYVYYSTEGTADFNPNDDIDVDDAIYRVRPDGTGLQTVATNICENVYKFILDLEHNQIIVYQSNYAKRQIITINVSNPGSPVITRRSFATSYIYVYDFTYNPNTGQIYYICEGNNAATSTSGDFLARQNLDGTGNVQLITSFLYYPYSMVGDWGNNRIYVNDNLAAQAKIVAVDLNTNTYATVPVNVEAGSGYSLETMAVPDPPKVTTAGASSVSSTSATLGGNLVFGYGLSTDRGVVYSSTNSTPTLSDGNVSMANNTANGAYSASVTGLNPTTTYYARAYAKNGAGTTYGTATTFTTLSNDATLSAFTTTAGTLTPSFTSATTSYTASVTSSTGSVTVTPTKNNANATIKVNGTVVNSGSASGAVNLNIGDNTITTVVTAPDGTTTKTYSLVVNRPKAAQTITFAAISAKTYGNADFAPGATTTSGLGVSYSSDNTAVATIVSGQIHIVGQGTANITASQAGDGNYSAASNVVQVLTVNKNAVTVTANTGQTKVYGNADPTLAYTVTSGTVKSGDTFSGSLTRAAGENVGSYAITQGTLALSNNYTLTFVSNDLAISKRPLEITPLPQTKVYGNAEPAGYPYTFTGGTSLASTDAMSGSFTRLAGETVGTYPLSIGTKHPVNPNNGTDLSNNYNITFISVDLTITKRPLTIAPIPVTKVYGEVDFANGAPYSFNGTSLAPGEGMTGTFGRTPSSENIGTYALTLGSKRPVDASNGQDRSANYDISFVTNSFTITQKSIGVNVYSQTKAYGDADPVLTYTSAPLSFSDAFTGALTRVAGENVGTYAINQGTLALSGNYNIIFVGADLTIGAKTINVTANAQTKTYGTLDPTFTYTNDPLSFGDVFTGSLVRDAGEDVGSHAITQGNLALSGNYILNYTGANLSIGKATLTYVASPASRPFQNPDPTFTGAVTGFVNGDNQASATTGTLSFTSTATLNSAMGSYPLVGSGLSAANYDFVQDASNATAFTITASNDALLAGITTDQGTLSPAFSSSEKSYNASVDNSVTSFNFSATLSSPDATMYFNGDPYTSGSTKNVTLHTGFNYFTLVTLAQDGTTTDTYALSLFRAYSTNNQLASLSLSGITFTPTFDTNTLNYTASVANSVSSTNVSAAAVDNTATLSVNGSDLAESGPYNYSLVVGENVVTVVSKAENGGQKLYTVTVTRAKSPDATLASFGNGSITLNTPIVNGTTTYSANVDNSVSQLIFKPTTTEPMATVTINGQPVDRYAGATINLAFGNNAIAFDVTSEDGENHIAYTLNVNRVLSSDASLSSLNFPFITSLNESFDPGVYEYTATVADSTYTGIPLTAIAANENAIVKIDGTVVPRFQNYTLPVHGGPNTYHIAVTSQDASDTKTYTLVLTRAGTPPPAQSPVANLYAINVNATGFSKNFNFNNGEELTTINTPNSIASVRIFAVSQNEVSTVTVNGITLPYDASTDLLPISVGDNLFTLVVTSEDGAHTKTYSVHVNRLPFADITLASLAINKGTLSPAFVAGTRSYAVTVPNNVTTLTVTPVATDGTATVQIGATTLNSSTHSVTVDLNSVNIPANRIRVVVTAADGVNTQTYTINVTRLAPGPNLESLVLNAGALSPTFDSATDTYTASVVNEITSVSVKPTAQDAGATITVNGDAVESGAPSNPIALSVGENTISVVGTAQDGVTTKTYTVKVTRVGSTNAKLKFTVSTGNLLVATDGTSDYNYKTSVDPSVTSLSVIPTARDANATIKVNGVAVISGQASSPVTLSAGETLITLVGTAQDGVTTATYTLKVTRDGSNNATMKLALSTGNVLISTDGPGDYNYMTSVDPALGALSVIPTATDASATIKVNGVAVVSGQASSPVTLAVGETLITLVGTAPDGVTTKTYTIKVNRTGSNNAKIKFALSTGNLLIATDGTNDYNYMTSVDPSVTSLSVIPTAIDANATIKVNGVAVISGQPSAPITLSVGETLVTLISTAQDGVTSKTYSLKITRNGSNTATMKLALSTGNVLVTTEGTGDYNYMTSVDPALGSVSVIPTAIDANATIKVNGVAVTSGQASLPITLLVGETLITAIGTAPDGVTTKTYTIKVTRTGSNNAKMKFALSTGNALVATDGTGDYNYMTSVDPGVSSLSVIPTAIDANATIKVNGVAVISGQASAPITLSVGETLITLIGTAQDGVTTKTYTLKITRNGSNTATMKLALSTGNTLISTTGTGDYNYMTSVDPALSSVSVIPTATDANATIKVNGVAVISGQASLPVTLSVGETLITLVGTAPDGVTTKTYTIKVNRTGSNNAKMKFALSTGNTLVATEGPGDYNYTATVGAAVGSVSVIPTARDANATITVNGVAVTSGHASSPITLPLGETTITLVGTAQDGVTTKTYILTVNRPAGGFGFDREGAKLLFANKAANNVAPTDNDGVVVHQGVSPNGDGSNDFLYIEGIDAYRGNKLAIMNTSGALVYEAKDYGKDGNNVFDGHSNKTGAQLKPGTYYYSLEYKVGNDNKRKTGYIILKY